MLMRSLIMEEKQLDFNRPLISVRRPTTTTQTSESAEISKTRSFDSVPPCPPVYKSDIKSGPVRNPGTVPFQWEHKPGKPKYEQKHDLQCPVETRLPKLPPGRRVMKPDYHVEDTAKSCSSRFNDDDDSDDTSYLDAVDTLSRSESFFFNCSAVSGVSGLDGSSGMILVEPPFGSLSSDRQTQDLMMGRFLPAAKALTTSETPPHLARKPPPKPEEPARHLMKKEKQNKVEEDENMMSSLASGVCGLLPQLCLRSSLGLLNPVPSVRSQGQRAVSVRRMRSKYQDSTTTTPSHQSQNKISEPVNKDKNESVAQGPSQPQGKEKLENFGNKVSKNFGELLASDDNTWKPSCETPVAEKTLYVDTVHKVQEESKETSISKEYTSLDMVPVKEAISQVNDNRDEEFTKLSSQKVEDSPPDQDCNHQAIIALPESNSVEVTKEKINLEVESQRITTNLESSRLHHHRSSSSYHIVPPPPLPKAPSDSWLKRTLPTIPTKNNSFAWLQSLGSTDDNHHITKFQSNPKWETMVKTSNTQQGFVYFSKETLNPIPEA